MRSLEAMMSADEYAHQRVIRLTGEVADAEHNIREMAARHARLLVLLAEAIVKRDAAMTLTPVESRP